MTVSVPLDARAGGPDLARGIALLGIALANLVGWLHGSAWTALLKQQDASAADRVVDVLLALLVDNRGFPLFALLFGYGIGILRRRSLERGERTGRFLRRMLRRHLVLLAIGLAHAILLFSGDILVGYAVIGMLCALLMTRGRVVLAAAAIVTLPALGVWGWVDGTVGLGGGSGYAAASAADYLAGVGIRAPDALHGLMLAPIEEIGLLSPMALGALMARSALLEDVPAHRRRLGRLARWGFAIGLVGAVPLAAVLVLDPAHARLDAEIVLGILGVLHQVSGLAGAVGLAAGTALLAARWDPRPVARAPGADGGLAAATPTVMATVTATASATGPPPAGARGPLGAAVRAVEALGAVSLSAYLAQSVLCLLLFPPYTLDLGAQLGSAGASALVLAGWLLMLPPAVLLRRSGRRGPMEHVLRALAGSSTPRTPRTPHTADAHRARGGTR
ncbi:DUF418 domain-containing protein [Brachybacterium sp. sponge]|uniref:DUF418 domain-containing protein n=1 Tax=Brachybacterium sp. sponge TaxID=1775432 RepID=UPI0007A5073B|nr:DUF418 domain-containing protein [Brachybacterium sp. sponge]